MPPLCPKAIRAAYKIYKEPESESSSCKDSGAYKLQHKTPTQSMCINTYKPREKNRHQRVGERGQSLFGA